MFSSLRSVVERRPEEFLHGSAREPVARKDNREFISRSRDREGNGGGCSLDGGPVDTKISPGDRGFFIRRLDTGIRRIRAPRAYGNPECTSGSFLLLRRERKWLRSRSWRAPDSNAFSTMAGRENVRNERFSGSSAEGLGDLARVE